MRPSVLLLIVTAVLDNSDAGTSGGLRAANPPADPQKAEVPGELVGAWEHGSIDFALWENYKKGHYAGRNAAPTREAMVIGKDGKARYYRYEFAFGVYEVLVDCEGTVTFPGDGTFTFSAAKGRKRFFDTRNPDKDKDRELTNAELSDAKWSGKRRYAYVASADPVAVRITVPGSAPYNWYKKP